MLKKIVLTIVIIDALCMTKPAVAEYLTTIQGGFQGVYQRGNSNSNKFLGMAIPLYQNKQNLVFTDIRFSQQNNISHGVHMGLAARHNASSIKYGIYGFYDLFNTKTFLSQYVAGVEVLFRNFHARMNGYYPYSTDKSYNVGMKGLEGELEIKIAQEHEAFLALKKYNFIDDKNNVDGYGIGIKYESPRKSKWALQSGVAYYYDNLHGSQIAVNFGMSIVMGECKDSCAKRIKHIQRNMSVYNKHNITQTETALLENKFENEVDEILANSRTTLAQFSDNDAAEQKGDKFVPKSISVIVDGRLAPVITEQGEIKDEVQDLAKKVGDIKNTVQGMTGDIPESVTEKLQGKFSALEGKQDTVITSVGDDLGGKIVQLKNTQKEILDQFQ